MSQRKPESRSPGAIAPLAVLPVFYDLQGKNVLVVGGREAAAWKAELLLAAGACVTVVATAIDERMEQIAASEGSSLTIERRDWCQDDFEGMVLAIGACETEADAERFAHTARASGVPANVIDRREWCDFQFGSVVNRSPLVIGISTAGAAPSLAQAVRLRIESLLPQSLAIWANKAREARVWLSGALPDASARRALWRRFAEAAFVRPANEAATFFQHPLTPQEQHGLVTLVGAGPGTEDLLTIRAVRAMQAADVILFDDLISDDVLELARREAKRMLVGKRGHRASCRQDDINALMIKLARQGKRVVRLKSGDPMIFGRGGEEITALEQAGIGYEVVPGVTAALAAASSLGVSLTHRDSAQAVKFITAHARNGQLPELDWRACADRATTLIVYMGARTAPLLAEKLIEQGMPASTPSVVLESVARPDETRKATTLGALLHGPVEADGPVLIGVGAVFSDVCAVADPHDVLPSLAADQCHLAQQRV